MTTTSSLSRRFASFLGWTTFACAATAGFFYGSAWAVGLVGSAFDLFDLG